MEKQHQIKFGETAYQLWLEFRWALAVAVVLAIGSWFFDTQASPAFRHIKEFFSTLAVVAYFSGNFNRVRHKQATDLKFQDAERRSAELLSAVHGGQGQCYVMLLPPAPAGEFNLMLMTLHSEAVYDITVVVYPAKSFVAGKGVGEFECESAGDPLFEARIDVVHPHEPRQLPALELLERAKGDALYVIKVTARNGTWREVLHARRFKSTVTWASKCYISARNAPNTLGAIMSPLAFGEWPEEEG